MSDLIERQAAIDAVKKNTFRLTFAEEQNCEGHVAWSAEAVYSDVMEGALLELPSAQPERKTGKWELIYKEPESDAWACNVTARCSCCGKPLKTLGDRIGWGNDRDTGETIIWSGFITNWKQHKEQARIFALNAGESVSDDLFPKYCENCGADMIGEQND